MSYSDAFIAVLLGVSGVGVGAMLIAAIRDEPGLGKFLLAVFGGIAALLGGCALLALLVWEVANHL